VKVRAISVLFFAACKSHEAQTAPETAVVVPPTETAPEPSTPEASVAPELDATPEAAASVVATPSPTPTYVHDRFPTGLKIHTPQLRLGTLTVNGRLPLQVIQRVLRQSFGRFRICYDDGLRNNPTLQGRVVVKFLINRDGSVGSSSDGGSDIPDQVVTQCVVRWFNGFSFPEPEEGTVTVVAPIAFSPGD
jgi:hypothetical protein